MNDIIDAVKARFSSPVFGYFGLSLLAFNWKGFFYIFFQEGDALSRIQYFEQQTSLQSLAAWPLLFSLAFSVCYPWVLYVVAWLTAKPTELKDMIQARSEHNLLLKRKQLEDARSSILANAELELIERAKRDQELDSLQSDAVREKLKSELEQLRAERDSAREGGQSVAPQARHKELMEIASTYRKRSEDSTNFDDQQDFLQRARELEEEAHNTLVKSGILGAQRS